MLLDFYKFAAVFKESDVKDLLPFMLREELSGTSHGIGASQSEFIFD